MSRYRAGLFASALFLVAGPRAWAASTYTCTAVTINAVDQFAYLFPISINNREQIGGVAVSPNASFVVDQTGMSVPYTPPPTGTVIQTSVNNSGQVAGWTGDPRSPWFPNPASGLQPPQGFISNADGTVLMLDPPADTPAQSFSQVRVSGINDNGDVLGTIGVTDQGGNLLQYWYIRSADGVYTLFDAQRNPFREIDRGNIIDVPVGAINNARTAILNAVLRYADGSEKPIAFRGMGYFLWNWWAIGNNGSLVGNFTRFPYMPPFSVLLSPDGNAPAIVCPDNNPSSILAFGINDDGVIAGAQIRGPTAILMHPTGLHSAVSLSNTSWGFSPSPAGQQGGSGIIYLSSTGPADLNIEAVIIDGRDANDSPADFNITRDNTTCIGLVDVGGGALATVPKTFTPGEFCTISFTFTARGVGARTAEIVVYDDAPDAPHIIRLNGTGLGKRNLIFSNNVWDFGPHPVGQTTPDATLYVYNPGTDAIDIGSVSISGPNASEFPITNNACGLIVSPYTTCAIQFKFAPASAGFRTAVLALTDDSPVRQQTIPMSGYAF